MIDCSNVGPDPEFEINMDGFETKFLYFTPTIDLQPYIKVIYLFESPYPGIKQYIPAWNKPLLVLQYADPIYSDINGEAEVVKNISISGFVSRQYEFYTPSPVIKLMVAEFTHTGMYSLLRESGRAFRNQSIDLLDVIPSSKKQEICEALYETEDIAKKVTLVESFIRRLLPDDISRKSAQVDSALDIIRKGNYNTPIHTIAKRLSISERSLQRNFKEVVGICPKTFSSIERFNRTINQIISSPEKDPLSLGFYDQSHLCKELKRFTGHSPTNLPVENLMLYHIFTR